MDARQSHSTILPQPANGSFQTMNFGCPMTGPGRLPPDADRAAGRDPLRIFATGAFAASEPRSLELLLDASATQRDTRNLIYVILQQKMFVLGHKVQCPAERQRTST